MTTPLCRCRVLYLGCAVPKISKDGLQGIQDPLKEIYPESGAVDANGIDAWLSVWSNGMLLEYLDSMGLPITKFMPVETLHYCAAVRYLEVTSVIPATSISEVVTMRFFPLDSPHASNNAIHHPPLFACIMRRTSGIKVLECHGFICKNEIAANALVKACFHAYSDSMHLRYYEYIPAQTVPVIIPKKKSIFKFGKKSRSKSVGPTAIPLRASSAGSSSISLDPYANQRVYTDWRTPVTPRPVYLRTTPPVYAPTPRLIKPVPASDYRYASNAILSSSSNDYIRKHKSRSGSQQSTGGGSGEHYFYGNGHYTSPLNNQTRPIRTRPSSRRSQNGDSEYADVTSLRGMRARYFSNEDVYSAATFPNQMTSYEPVKKPGPREEYYESTSVETRKNGKAKKNRKVEEHEQSSVAYYRNNPAPYIAELERTLSNGNHLPKRNSGYKRYESMPDLNKIGMIEGSDRDLPHMMKTMRLQGSAGSADHYTSTGNTTPLSTPVASFSDSLRERERRMRSPEIPEADYYH